MLTFGFDFPTIVAFVITLIVALTVHELAHAVVADQLGDDTPRRQGRITINPSAHLDVVGSIMFLLVGFGWAKPVMVNPFNLRGDPRSSMAIVAVAGPLSNLVLAILGAIPLRLYRMGFLPLPVSIVETAFALLTIFVFLNLFLLFFNLIPIAPLDGSKILKAFVSPKVAYQIEEFEQRYGMIVFLVIVFVLPNLSSNLDILNIIVAQPSQYLFGLLVG